MKNLRRLIAAALLTGSLVVPAVMAETKEKKDAKPYPLENCLISDEKLGADPDMKPFAFVHEGQEIKLCCKSCKKDFDKDPKKYITKLAEEAKKAKDKAAGK